MVFRFFQYLGIAIIVAFACFSVLISVGERDFIPNNQQDSLLSYASFFENRFFDLRSSWTLNKKVKDTRIVLAAIDDDSLNSIGRWPWTRTVHAKLIDKLNLFGAKVIAFDVFYSEPELACNAESPDNVLLRSIQNFQKKPGNKIILPYSTDEKISKNIDETRNFKEMPGELLNFILDSKISGGAALEEKLISKKVYPISALANSDVGIAHIEAEADIDGVFRHYPIVANIDTLYLPSFSLMAYQFYTGDKPSIEVISQDYSFLKTQKGITYLNYRGENKVRWIGSETVFPQVSVKNILHAKDNDSEMKNIFDGKIVFVGSTAFGAHDLRNTPVSPMMPGVFMHMNMTNMLLEGRFYVSDNESGKYSWILLLSGTILIIVIMLLGHAILDFVTVNIIIGSYLLLDHYYFIPRGYEIRLFFCLFSVVLCYSWSTFLHFYQSNKEKKKIKGTFSRYLAPSIVNDLLKNPDKLKLGGEKKNITVFFSDVRDFTSISEKLTPEQLTICLNKYMTMMTDTLFEYKGTLDKYIGDAMVAYWGAPVDLPNHAYWAVKGAIQMIEKLPAINEEFKKEGFPTFKHGIGLNTGECSVGNMGSNQIFSYTALGDNMNLGARLESLCKYYGVQLNISEYTKNAIPEDFQKEFKFRTLDKVKVKGKENAVTIFEVLHPSHHLYQDDDALKNYEIAFSKYQTKDFSEAIHILTPLHNKYPEDQSFKRIIDICNDFLEVPPPPGWDGTYTHKTK